MDTQPGIKQQIVTKNRRINTLKNNIINNRNKIKNCKSTDDVEIFNRKIIKYENDLLVVIAERDELRNALSKVVNVINNSNIERINSITTGCN